MIVVFGYTMPRGFRLPPDASPPAGSPDWRALLLKRGWGYAILDTVSVQPDSGEGLSQGIIGLTNKGQPRKMGDWGSLRAWAWGASRVVDYLQTDPHVAADQIGIEGISRYGKAAIVAMAFDQRFAIGYVASSGAGGAKLLRRNAGETLEDIAAPNEFHWFAGNFLKYAVDPLTANDIPVDADALVALCTPRPVFIGSGSLKGGDAWVDPRGLFDAAVGAGAVYRLLGKKGLETDTYPSTGQGLLEGDIGFRVHPNGHTDVPNWPTFIEFAGKYLRAEP